MPINHIREFHQARGDRCKQKGTAVKILDRSRMKIVERFVRIIWEMSYLIQQIVAPNAEGNSRCLILGGFPHQKRPYHEKPSSTQTVGIIRELWSGGAPEAHSLISQALW